ncbi:hypothetical protein F5144DRAFT_652073 [Chaetomium tenue]|uniref:Uncharacterized protein n=1 Tax=Chaetomium tenue TaxID=1854479 RepID=A0ACB7P2U8_9PEZI|nr:hypothetical protein F5144DRAFT_652073 [Chaetomium globosum]
MSQMPSQSPDPDLGRGLTEGNAESSLVVEGANKGGTSSEPPEKWPPLGTCATPSTLKPGIHIPLPSPHPTGGRSASPSPPPDQAPHHRKRPRGFTPRPTRPVRRSRQASSTSSSRASSYASGSPRRRSPSLTNRPAKGRAIPPDGPPPSEKPPAAAGSGYGSVTLHPRDAENQVRWAIVGARRQSKHKLKRLLGITEPAPPGQRIFRVSFAEMQRLKLRKLQVKLVDHAIDMFVSKQESVGWEKNLEKYTQALKDYDYMLETSKLPQDYFYATGERAADRYVIRRLAGDLDGLGDQTNKVAPVELWDDENMTIGGTRNRNYLVVPAFWEWTAAG